MTAPRLRQHADGRVALRFATEGCRAGWLVITERPYAAGGLPLVQRDRTDADVHGEGWSDAALVALPEPVVTTPVAWSRTAKCGPVTARCFADGAPQINSGVQSYRDPPDARRYAAGLLAAADWCDRYQRGETP